MIERSNLLNMTGAYLCRSGRTGEKQPDSWR